MKRNRKLFGMVPKMCGKLPNLECSFGKSCSPPNFASESTGINHEFFLKLFWVSFFLFFCLFFSYIWKWLALSFRIFCNGQYGWKKIVIKTVIYNI